MFSLAFAMCISYKVFMEVKINREIRNYTESMFFGLSLRQCVFSVLAIAVAVGLYFLLRPMFGLETLSWVCVLGAAPFAALGFFTYHGMAAELTLRIPFSCPCGGISGMSTGRNTTRCSWTRPREPTVLCRRST